MQHILIFSQKTWVLHQTLRNASLIKHQWNSSKGISDVAQPLKGFVALQTSILMVYLGDKVKLI